MMLSKSIFKGVSILLLFSAFQLFSQQKVFTGNPDVAFEMARKMAFDGQRKKAQEKHQ